MWTFIAAVAFVSALLGVGLARPGEGEGGSPRANRFAWALAGVCLLLYLNQVAFQVYVFEEHGGSTAFLGRTFSRSFFRPDPDHPPVVLLRRWLDGAAFLEPSVLRMQAVLELPFALFAYLAVAWLFDPSLAGRIARGLIGLLACVSYTAVLVSIEILLWNRYTVDDLWLRGVALLLVPALLRWWAGPPVRRRPPSAVGLLLFGVGAGAMSVIVLGVNLVALLYNPGWLSALWLPMLGAALLFALVSRCSLLPGGRGPAPVVVALDAIGRRFLLAFCVPALAIRYGASRPESAQVAASSLGIVLVAALGLGLRDAWRAVPPERRRRWWGGVAGGLLVGALAPLVDLERLTGIAMLGLSDLWFVQKAALGLVGFVVGFTVGEALVRSR